MCTSILLSLIYQGRHAYFAWLPTAASRIANGANSPQLALSLITSSLWQRCVPAPCAVFIAILQYPLSSTVVHADTHLYIMRASPLHIEAL